MSDHATAPAEAKGVSLWSDAYRRLCKDRIAVLCFWVIVAYAVLAIATVAGAFPDPDQSYGKGRAAPDAEHWFGLNTLGQHVGTRIAGGTWIAMSLGFSTALVATFIGGVLGAIAGWFGGIVDEIVSWGFNTLSAIPPLLLIIAFAYVLRSGFGKDAAFWAVLLAMGLTNWVGVCRVIRAEVMKLRDRDYVLAARALGLTDRRILVSHVAPNFSHLLIISFSLLFVEAIKAEVVISFLGVGMVDKPSWGLIIQDAEVELTKGYWWQMTYTSIALFGIVLAFQVFGDALRDALDPRLRH